MDFVSPSSTRLAASPRIDARSSGLREMLSTPAPHLEVPLYSFFINPWTPLLFGLAYFGCIKLASHYSDGKNRISGKRWNAVVVLHNALLAGYSGWTFACTAPTFLGAFWRAWWEGGLAGLTHVFCDSSMAQWTATKFPVLCYYFYLSKFFEVIDSIIILLKGRKVGLLQSYHHTGAIWTMYAGFRFSAPPIWIFVVFNSAIHSLMYLYYALTSMKLPFPAFLKRNLTRLQISQFLIGGSLAASYLFIQLPSLPTLPSAPSIEQLKFNARHFNLESVERVGTMCLVGTGQRAATYLNVFYLIPLTYLFVAFFINSYRKGKGKRKQDAVRESQTPVQAKCLKGE